MGSLWIFCSLQWWKTCRYCFFCFCSYMGRLLIGLLRVVRILQNYAYFFIWNVDDLVLLKMWVLMIIWNDWPISCHDFQFGSAEMCNIFCSHCQIVVFGEILRIIAYLSEKTFTNNYMKKSFWFLFDIVSFEYLAKEAKIFRLNVKKIGRKFGWYCAPLTKYTNLVFFFILRLILMRKLYLKFSMALKKTKELINEIWILYDFDTNNIKKIALRQIQFTQNFKSNFFLHNSKIHFPRINQAWSQPTYSSILRKILQHFLSYCVRLAWGVRRRNRLELTNEAVLC